MKPATKVYVIKTYNAGDYEPAVLISKSFPKTCMRCKQRRLLVNGQMCKRCAGR